MRRSTVGSVSFTAIRRTSESICNTAYILASGYQGTLYIGVTSDLIKRVWQHKGDFVDGFTKRYGVHRLVWYEQHATMEAAITREKQLKKWNRSWKIRLIEESIPQWRELYESLG